MFISFEKTGSLSPYTNDNGEKRYYPLYRLDLDGDLIASEYPRLDLSPTDVTAIVDMVNEKIEDVICDLIDTTINEYFI